MWYCQSIIPNCRWQAFLPNKDLAISAVTSYPPQVWQSAWLWLTTVRTSDDYVKIYRKISQSEFKFGCPLHSVPWILMEFIGGKVETMQHRSKLDKDMSVGFSKAENEGSDRNFWDFLWFPSNDRSSPSWLKVSTVGDEAIVKTCQGGQGHRIESQPDEGSSTKWYFKCNLNVLPELLDAPWNWPNDIALLTDVACHNLLAAFFGLPRLELWNDTWRKP